ncbi:helix-turn-helix domain-containing protein [Saliphagus infecundisoli]|uniref:Helix-turn-helix domain-containing protein n=1 Tax=Saliphagus infecundisoli TaxID=1849069 RepID=A0ABD5QCE9_9EURY|nr:helix-turn-helix domain-containing protein [Saliphagus infecundisoli]
MSLIVECQLRAPDLPFGNVVDAVPDLTLELESMEQSHSGPLVLFIRATAPSFDGLRSGLEDSPFVEDYFLISEVESMRLYQLILTIRRPPLFDELLVRKRFPESVTIRADGLYVKQQFANHDEFATWRYFHRDMGISVQIDRLYESTSTDAELIGVSDKQREALLTAYEVGYFAVPQQASLDDIEAELDISRSALAERLHRAQAHLIEHFFYADLY